MAIDPDEIQDQIFVVEENPGFHDKYVTDVERRVWGIKDMRTSWPLEFREFAKTQLLKTQQEDDSSDDEPIPRKRSTRRNCC